MKYEIIFISWYEGLESAAETGSWTLLILQHWPVKKL
jgi:hypothetical protein